MSNSSRCSISLHVRKFIHFSHLNIAGSHRCLHLNRYVDFYGEGAKSMPQIVWDYEGPTNRKGYLYGLEKQNSVMCLEYAWFK